MLSRACDVALVVNIELSCARRVDLVRVHGHICVTVRPGLLVSHAKLHASREEWCGIGKDSRTEPRDYRKGKIYRPKGQKWSSPPNMR